ncbi:hypothetical protein QWI17_13585 [Gilvimarinus sp. SDUM040013]|uniref:Uncharacterized protein n=1 Tax=Gilvimarinus gilvus TaxID=3058038 RepID=A0ABU4RV98_9GAMM|nr:hypothetical protein [Gilvimarinus sp. SDUM040013]MDO3386874.1 hypothetical protein [Gilvimarinus sp. SDUM040013]MDX6848196.1 hypothetical protein [Gilvimarinus sp. SDUM040013]
MTKDEFSWLIVRLLGVLCLGWGLFLLLEFLVSVLVVVTYEPSEVLAGQNTVRLPHLNWNSFIGSVFLLGASIYLLWFGSLVKTLLKREGEFA